MDSQNSTSTTEVQASMDSSNSATRSRGIVQNVQGIVRGLPEIHDVAFCNPGNEGHDTGNALLVKHNGLMMAAVLALLVNFLVFVLATVLQLNAEARSLITVIVLGSNVSVLVSFVISSAIGWLTLSLWLCVFAVLAVAIIKTPSN